MSKRDSSVTLEGQRQLAVSAVQVRSNLIASIGLCDAAEMINDEQLLSRFSSILVESAS
jgi:hypothetical protein